MMNEETRRKLRILNIGEFIDAYDLQEQDTQSAALPFDDRFQQLTDSVYQQKYNGRVQRLIKAARFRFPKADIHDVCYQTGRPIDRNTINELATCRFVEDRKSVILQGYASSGKTFLGCALGKEACRHLYRTKYVRLPDLLMEYDEKSLMPGGEKKVLAKYTAFNVLVLDEWLISDLSAEELSFLFELADRRFDSASTIFCTLYRTEDWNKRLGGGARAESITERYSYDTIRLETGEINMREILSGHHDRG